MFGLKTASSSQVKKECPSKVLVQHNYRVFLFNLYKVFIDIFKKWGKKGYMKKFVPQAETWTCGYRIVEQENYSWRKELRKKIFHIKAN